MRKTAGMVTTGRFTMIKIIHVQDMGCSGEERYGVVRGERYGGFMGGEMWGVQGGERWGVQGRKETKFPISTSKSTCYFSAKF